MTTMAMPSGDQETIAYLAEQVRQLTATVEALAQALAHAGVRARNACARNEPLSGDKIRVDSDFWVKLEPSLEKHPDAELLDQVIAEMRPDIAPDERWKVLRDFCRLNASIAKSKNQTAKARKMGDFRGFVFVWEDKLGKRQAEERERRANLRAMVKRGVVKASQSVKKAIKIAKASAPTSDKDLDVVWLASRADFSTYETRFDALVERFGRKDMQRRVDDMMALGAKTQETARRAVVGRAIEADVIGR